MARPSNQTAWIILVLVALLCGAALLILWRLGREAPADRSPPRPQHRAARSVDTPESPGTARPPGGTLTPAQQRAARAALRRQLAQRQAQVQATGDPNGPSGRRGDTLQGDAENPGAADPVFEVSAQGIWNAIRARIDEVKACYEGWLTQDDTLAGGIKVSFDIESTDDPYARITNATIASSTMAHPHLERCVLVMVESLRFENPTDGRVTVRYPFRFAVASDSARAPARNSPGAEPD